MIVGTIGRSICRAEADAHTEIVGSRDTEAVAIFTRQFTIATVIGAFARTRVFVITLILQGKVQTIYQAEEIAVAVGRHAVGTAEHEDVSLGVGIAAEFRQHIGPGFNIINNAVVAAVVQ